VRHLPDASCPASFGVARHARRHLAAGLQQQQQDLQQPSDPRPVHRQAMTQTESIVAA